MMDMPKSRWRFRDIKANAENSPKMSAGQPIRGWSVQPVTRMNGRKSAAWAGSNETT